jgi:hypothetical protein
MSLRFLFHAELSFVCINTETIYTSSYKKKYGNEIINSPFIRFLLIHNLLNSGSI